MVAVAVQDAGAWAVAADALDTAAALPAGELDAESLLARLRVIAGLQARLAALEAATLRAVDAREAYRHDQAPTTKAWLRHHLRLDPGDAATRLVRARLVAELPRFTAALAAGQVNAGHLDALLKARRTLGPAPVQAAEDTLLALARVAAPAEVRTATARLREARSVRLSETFGGAWVLDGVLDPADGLLLQTALDAHSRRRALPDGSPDPRTPSQRRADALVAFAADALADGAAPAAGGVAPHVTLLLDPATGLGHTDHCHHSNGQEDSDDAPVSTRLRGLVAASLGTASLQRLTCWCSLSPVVASEWGVPMFLGRAIRTVTPAQLRALWVRDGGCVTPGCDSRRVQAHHVVHWLHGGPTDLDNLVLLCERCHHLLHDDGWILEHDPRRPGLFQFRNPRGGPPTPAVHTVDRRPGTSIPLPFEPADP